METRDLVRRKAVTCGPDATLAEVARRMLVEQVGSVLVVNELGIAGMVTDRDVVVRGLAAGLGPDARVETVMSTDVQYVFEDSDVFSAASRMAEHGCRRLPIVNSENGVGGVIALDDLIVLFADQIAMLASAVRKEISQARSA